MFMQKPLINLDEKCVTCISDNESQASLSQFAIVSRKKKIAYQNKKKKKKDKVTALTN